MRRPWNQANVPVYSLATQQNMNICTYVTPITLKPKKFCIAIYKNTQTLENWNKTKKGVLQLLTINQKKYVTLLGKKSGKIINKLEKLQNTESWHEHTIFSNCRAVFLLQEESRIDAGDHEIIICNVIEAKNKNNAPILYLDAIR